MVYEGVISEYEAMKEEVVALQVALESRQMRITSLEEEAALKE